MQVIIPHGCLLDPSDTAAVVGGNVLTSQRVVDVVLRAFEVCAASQVTTPTMLCLVIYALMWLQIYGLIRWQFGNAV